MKKYLSSLVLCGFCSIVFSVDNYQNTGSNDEMNYGHYNMITPSASPTVNDGCDLFIDADFIYWTAREEGLALAGFNSRDDSTTPTNNSTIPQKQSLYLNGKYSPGFKVGIGTNTNHDGWDLYIQYTWFRTKPTSSTYSGDGIETRELLSSILFNNNLPFLNGFPGVAERVVNSFWRFRFNNFDFELGRNFFVSSFLTLRPHFGVKGGWQHQRFVCNWQFNDADIDDITWVNATYQQNLKQKMWNVGLRTGLDTSWMFTKNWSLFGDFALSGVWTDFTITQVDTATTTGAPDAASNVSNFQTYNQGSDYKIITPVFELALGLRFDWWFSNDDYRFRLQAGWENQVWFNQNNFGEVTPFPANFISNNTNLTMQGLTVEVRFDF